VNHRELLIALAELGPTRIKGQFERHCSLKWEELRPSSSGGRWGAPGAFEVLYLGRPSSSVLAEAYRHLVDDELDFPDLAAQVLERRLITCQVDAPGILDLRPTAVRDHLGLNDEIFTSDVGEYEFCQRLGAAAHQLRASGLIVPSASRLGETLALFTLNLPAENWPQAVARSIWHGLPPDPRRLRLTEEEAP
jgi:RES domain-containing protein